MSVFERFIAKVCMTPTAATGCWEWTASKDKCGYGRLLVDRKARLAHRLSYEFFREKISPGFHVCHRCDNPGCVNPEHLFLGTDADNCADRDAKGRRPPPKGTVNGRARLTEKDITEIRAANGIRQVDLAKQYGVAQTQISRIRRGEHWRHI